MLIVKSKSKAGLREMGAARRAQLDDDERFIHKVITLNSPYLDKGTKIYKKYLNPAYAEKMFLKPLQDRYRSSERKREASADDSQLVEKEDHVLTSKYRMRGSSPQGNLQSSSSSGGLNQSQ